MYNNVDMKMSGNEKTYTKYTILPFSGAVVGAIVGSLLFICMVFVSIYIGRR